MNPLTLLIVIGVSAFLGTLFVLWLYNRREKRRLHALELASLMDQWSLSWFAALYKDYAVGNYSGLAYRVKEVVTAVRTDEAMVAKLWDVTQKVTTHIADSDPVKAEKLLSILQTGKEYEQRE